MACHTHCHWYVSIDCVFCLLGWGDLHWVWSSSKKNRYYVSYLRNFYQNPKRSEENLSIICVPDVRPLQVAFVHQTFMVSSPYNMCFYTYILYISKISPHLREDMLKKISQHPCQHLLGYINLEKTSYSVFVRFRL